MIDVGMGEQNVSDRQRLPVRKGEQAGHLIPRIDQHGFMCALASDHEPVLKERPDGLRLDYDHVVILAILDDLMFTSKIKLAATQAGVPVGFARSADSALADMRRSPPALVILDLNNPRTDPLGTVAAMKADATLAGIPTIGFVSHVDTVTIDAARQAGVGDVLARSAFVQRLPEILALGNQSPKGTL
jgi:PleD family two-component response regulator